MQAGSSDTTLTIPEHCERVGWGLNYTYDCKMGLHSLVIAYCIPFDAHMHAIKKRTFHPCVALQTQPSFPGLAVIPVVLGLGYDPPYTVDNSETLLVFDIL